MGSKLMRPLKSKGGSLLTSFKAKGSVSGPNWFASLDEARAPNVKQYLRGMRNYYLLSSEIKVSK